jgi:hypothetical protein
MVDYLKDQLIKEAAESISKELDEKRKNRNKAKAARRKASVQIKKRGK